jgi:hypothetical protein
MFMPRLYEDHNCIQPDVAGDKSTYAMELVECIVQGQCIPHWVLQLVGVDN